MAKRYFILFLIFVLFFSSCQEKKAEYEEVPEIQVSTTLYSYEWIGLHSRSINNPNTVIVDLRPLEDYNDGKVQGAIHLDYHDPEFEVKLDEFDKEKTYLIYSSTGGESTKALDIMYLLNFIEVYDLRGGLVSLEEIGYQLNYDYDE